MARRYRNRPVNKEKIFQWIEKLLKKPLDVEGRYYCTWRVLAPYLITVKGLSRYDAFDIISSWLDRCNSLRRLPACGGRNTYLDFAGALLNRVQSSLTLLD